MKDSGINADRLGAILDYWIEHNEGHHRENEKWLRSVEEYSNDDITRAIRKALELSDAITRQVRDAKAYLHGHGAQEDHGHRHYEDTVKGIPHRHIQFHQIGTIHTPYAPGTPSSEMRSGDSRCSILMDERYSEGLWKLNSFSYIILLFFLDRVSDESLLIVSPPWAEGVQTGLFASRSPNRPNPIGLSVVPLMEISGNVIYTGNIDAFDETPLLDIKPYIEVVESKEGAGNGWIDELDESLKSNAFNDASK
jgi:tRNA-Thr(GGU) m(6)t(6)A37 methyltransferase TsaA